MSASAVLTRVAGMAAAGLTVVLLSAAPASAHASLVGETPTDGTVIRVAPAKVVVRFDENIRQPSVVIVTGPGGQRADHGATTVLDNTASVAVTVGERGRYTTSYRVISADGHPVSAQTTFDYRGPTTAGSPTQASAGPGSAGSPAASAVGSPGTVWLVLGVLVALLAAAALLLAGRRRQPPASDTGEDLGTAAEHPRSPL